MRKINSTLIAASALCILASCSTKEQVPQVVSAAFSEKFPEAKSVQWEKENASEWEAEFQFNGQKYAANFALDGAWKETEYEISKSEIPETVKATLDSQFSEYKIEVAEIMVSDKGNVYELVLESKENEMEVTIDAIGKILSKKELEIEPIDGD